MPITRTTLLFILIAISASIWASYELEDDELMFLRDYCQQVQLFEESDGKYGWPDYKGIYYTDCK